jgi:hypothetical protein
MTNKHTDNIKCSMLRDNNTECNNIENVICIYANYSKLKCFDRVKNV